MNMVKNKLVVSSDKIADESYGSVYPIRLWEIPIKEYGYVYSSIYGAKIVLDGYRAKLWELATGNDTNLIVGLVGRNGSGKTTFVKSCTNLITFEGDIVLADGDGKRKLCYKDYSAVLEGNRNIFWKLTVLENIRYFAGLRGIKFSMIKDTSMNLLQRLSLLEKKDCLVETLSRGMKQKVALVCALVVGTPLLFLDEPTLGLDIESRNQLRDFLLYDKDFVSNRLIVITSHDLPFIREVTQKQFFIQNGHVYEVKLDDYNPNVYKAMVGGSAVKEKECPSGVCFKDGEAFIDTHLIQLSDAIRFFESNGMELSELIRLNKDIESFYLGFIKMH